MEQRIPEVLEVPNGFLPPTRQTWDEIKCALWNLLFHIVEFCFILLNFVPYRGILFHIVEFCSILWNFVPCRGILFHIVEFRSKLWNLAPYILEFCSMYCGILLHVVEFCSKLWNFAPYIVEFCSYSGILLHIVELFHIAELLHILEMCSIFWNFAPYCGRLLHFLEFMEEQIPGVLIKVEWAVSY